MQRSEVMGGISARQTLSIVYRKYGGQEEAEAVIAELEEQTETLESWATGCLNEGERPFRFNELPGQIRQRARRLIAIALLAQGAK